MNVTVHVKEAAHGFQHFLVKVGGLIQHSIGQVGSFVWNAGPAAFHMVAADGKEVLKELPDITAEMNSITSKFENLGAVQLAITIDPSLAKAEAAVNAAEAAATGVVNEVEKAAGQTT